MGLVTLPSLLGSFRFSASPDIPHFGPAGNYTPKIKAAFIRREENYGMLWPGEIYDGEAARKSPTNPFIPSKKVKSGYSQRLTRRWTVYCWLHSTGSSIHGQQ